MNKYYNPAYIEPKWQKFWKDSTLFKAEDFSKKPPFWVLDMFPYPSGLGLHVGHPVGYTATDALKRMKKAQGYNVLHTMGWDAFGLPTEQHAIRAGKHPKKVTKNNIVNFKKQLDYIGITYDWSREINTTHPDFIKWTQWIFSKLFHYNLAYVENTSVWFCSKLGIVLANEEVFNTYEGPRSKIGNYLVERIHIRQWMLRITKYAEKLLSGLKKINWPVSTKNLQKNWIGKSVGAEIYLNIDGLENNKLCIFTTRPDTIWGATYVALAPEHPLIDKIIMTVKRKEVRNTSLNNSGSFTGRYVINPINGEKLPIWITENLSTGAIIAVPAHDERYFNFAKNNGLDIRQVVYPNNINRNNIGSSLKEAFIQEGILWNCGPLNGVCTKYTQERIIYFLEKQRKGWKAVNYKMRDWIFSRQRYWGEPFPILWLKEKDYKYILTKKKCFLSCNTISYKKNGVSYLAINLPERVLPINLPELSNYLNWIKVWVNLKSWETIPRISKDPKDGGFWLSAKRDTNTMPQWAGSCWYYFRYLDPRNPEYLFIPSKEVYWGMPDLYVGGYEHAVLHLLYSRFWHIFLKEIGVIKSPEPFHNIFHQGIILGKDGEKMSKSRGNVVNPENIIKKYGADTLRLHLMFLGPLEAVKPWKTNSIIGIVRYLHKVWLLVINFNGCNQKESIDLIRLRHETIKKVTKDYQSLSFNTAIAQMMIYTNAIYKSHMVSRESVRTLLQLLAPIAPHIAEELWERLGEIPSIINAPWPKYDSEKLKCHTVKIIIQVMGRSRGYIMVPVGSTKEDILNKAKNHDKISMGLKAQSIIKVIYVPNRIVNFVVK